jgi:hypothetical protein
MGMEQFFLLCIGVEWLFFLFLFLNNSIQWIQICGSGWILYMRVYVIHNCMFFLQFCSFIFFTFNQPTWDVSACPTQILFQYHVLAYWVVPQWIGHQSSSRELPLCEKERKCSNFFLNRRKPQGTVEVSWKRGGCATRLKYSWLYFSQVLKRNKVK